MQAIIDAGRGEYQIVAPDMRSGPEWHAAQILQQTLREMTGVTLPVREARQRLTWRPALLVGVGAENDAAPILEKDAFEIVPAGRDLVLRGTHRRGTLYAVHAFLESLGVRYYGFGEVHVPRTDRVDLPAGPTDSTAAMAWREVFYPHAQTPEWAVRWRLNAHEGRDLRWGPTVRNTSVGESIGHSFGRLVPPAKHFDAHPEYFSLVDGERKNYAWQLCCTNPDVASVAQEAVADWIASRPEQRLFAVGLNDGYAEPCECPTCAAADRREGTHAGQLLTLVNRVAERFPDKIIPTLAYSWGIEPPKHMRAADNVLIVLCHDRGCFFHGLDECKRNETFLRYLDGWRKQARHVLIWDYFVDFYSYLMPTPNFRRIGQDLRRYRDAGVDGMFCQGSRCEGGQFAGPRQYVLARLLWDPDLDAWDLLGEWLLAVYGREAGQRVWDYVDLLESHVRDNDVHMPAFGMGQETMPELFAPQVLRKGKELWDAAEAAAETDAQRVKLEAARATEMLSRLMHTGGQYVVRGEKLVCEPAADAALRERFVAAAMAGGAGVLRENDYAPEQFGRDHGRTYDLVTLRSDALQVRIVPAISARIYSLATAEDGTELLEVGDLFQRIMRPHEGGGYEPSVAASGNLRSRRREMEVVEADGARAVLRSEPADGRVLTSEFVLDGAELRLSHTIENVGDEPIDVTPATHPEWSWRTFGSAASVAMRRADGSWDLQPVNPDDRVHRDIPFAGDQMPAGAWRLMAPDGRLAVEETFDPDAVTQVKLIVNKDMGALFLEVQFRPVRLAPREQCTFGVTWRVLTGAQAQAPA